MACAAGLTFSAFSFLYLGPIFLLGFSGAGALFLVAKTAAAAEVFGAEAEGATDLRPRAALGSGDF